MFRVGFRQAVAMEAVAIYQGTGQLSGRKSERRSEVACLNGTRGKKLGWTGLVRVNGNTYVWMGNPGSLPLSEQLSFEYTATRSTFILKVADTIRLNATFLSPVFPFDLKRQSIPFSYLNVDLRSLDGQTHDVQIYTDISTGMKTICGFLKGGR